MELDARWIEANGKNDHASSIRNNEYSKFLRVYQKTGLEKYGEIFLTSRMGTTVAMTGTLSDYYQADEQWWLESFSNGEGRIFSRSQGF